MSDALSLAVRFHETYERLAPSFGYETRTETRAFDPTTPNGRLMVAVCGELLLALATTATPDGWVTVPTDQWLRLKRVYRLWEAEDEESVSVLEAVAELIAAAPNQPPNGRQE